MKRKNSLRKRCECEHERVRKREEEEEQSGRAGTKEKTERTQR